MLEKMKKSKNDIGEEIVSERVQENTRQMRDRIQASTEESKIERIVFGQVPKKGPGEYQERGRIQVSTGEGSRQVPRKGQNPGEYRKRIQVSTREGSERVPGKGQNLGEYRRRVRASTEKPKKKLAKHNNTKKEGVCPSMNMRTPLNDSNKQEIKHLNHERRRGMPQCDVQKMPINDKQENKNTINKMEKKGGMPLQKNSEM